MIRITKSTIIPRPLRGPTSRGGKATLKLCEQVDAGDAEFTFNGDIYGDPAVKTQLIADQHGKCVFCEAKIRANEHGDVEHFRPKGGFTETDNGPFKKPGYYWLAYDWSNLTFSCQLCNQSHKKNHFPLLDPRHRANSHHDQLAKERPVLVNPTEEDPELFIGFHEEVAFGLDHQSRGETTIRTVGLNRELIVENRRDQLVPLRDAWEMLVNLEALVDQLDAATRAKLPEIRRRMLARANPESEFSAMCASFLRSVGAIE